MKKIGLINMNARHYDPVLGRFISADSIIPGIDTPLAYNRYAYVNGNPISYRDPTGHDPFTIGSIIVTAAFVGAHLTDNEDLQLASRIALIVYLGLSFGTGNG